MGYTPWGIPYPDPTHNLDDTDYWIRELKRKANDLITNRPMVYLSLAANTSSAGGITIPTGLSVVTGGVVMVQGPDSATRYMWTTFPSSTAGSLGVRFYVPSTMQAVGGGVGFWLKAIAWGTQ
jgi:hypothetical protein